MAAAAEQAASGQGMIPVLVLPLGHDFAVPVGHRCQPDVMVTRTVHQTVAIEAKWADATADSGVAQVRARYLERLRQNHGGDPCNAAVRETPSAVGMGAL